ncbi:hypothetical protein IWX90DRAFT_446385 [Phyllosticta citrichinensis]|uniref:Uncharacterized protein n=1 Tax=Phyllosticta citrichinensis TaxID=1130410 RepID=A0ABR1XEZ6_9PEZI
MPLYQHPRCPQPRPARRKFLYLCSALPMILSNYLMILSIQASPCGPTHRSCLVCRDTIDRTLSPRSTHFCDERPGPLPWPFRT